MLLASEGKICFCQKKDPKPELWPLLPRDIDRDWDKQFEKHSADKPELLLSLLSSRWKNGGNNACLKVWSSYLTYHIEACLPIILLQTRNTKRGTFTLSAPEICYSRQPYKHFLLLAVKKATANSWTMKRSQGCLTVSSFTLKGNWKSKR